MMKKLFLSFLMLCCMATLSFAQSIVMTSGTADFVKGEAVIKFTFSFSDMLVGKMTESEYITKKQIEYNEKESGKGDEWVRRWTADRTERFEPKFVELFDKYLLEKGVKAGEEGAHYVIEINTDFTEPGWNVGIMRQNASVDLSCKVKKIDTGEHIATIRIRNASANNFLGVDFDSGYRIQECYGKAGRELAKFFIKKAKL